MSRFPLLFHTATALALSGSVFGGDLEFNRDIRPILSENCFQCHGPDPKTREAKLRLDTREGALQKSAIVPGNLEDSEVIYRIFTEDADEVMPPPDSHLSLTKEEAETLKKWIKEGAEYQGHWAFEAPTAKSTGSLRAVIDAEIRKSLQDEGLEASQPASRETLIRRLSLDLRGLPPSLKEVDDFLHFFRVLIMVLHQVYNAPFFEVAHLIQ